MKKIILFFNILLSITTTAQNWQWAKNTVGYNVVCATVTDATGNIYAAGNYGSGPGQSNVFLAKYSSGGALLWITTAGGSSDDILSGITIDASGSIYIAGYCGSPSMTFGSITVTNQNSCCNLFLAKYNSAGSCYWAKISGGSGAMTIGNSVAADPFGNIYVIGRFEGSTTFGLNSTGGWDFFLIKYDANGNILWARSIDGNLDEEAGAVTCDSGGNIYLTGQSGSASFIVGTTTFTSNNHGYNIFIVKYDSSGNVVWAKSAGGGDEYNAATSIKLDPNNNLIVAGYFKNDSLIFGSNTIHNHPIINNQRYNDVFLVKYDFNGNSLWAKSAGGNDDDYCSSIFPDSFGSIWATGYYKSTTMVINTYTLSNTSQGTTDIFTARFDGNGNANWVSNNGGNYNDYSYCLTIDGSGNTIIGGDAQSSQISFGADTITNQNPNDDNMFVAKLITQSATGIKNTEFSNTINIFPNPVHNNITIVYCSNKSIALQIILRSTIGEIIFSENIKDFTGEYRKQIDMSNQPKGIFFLEILEDGQTTTKKVIVE